MVYKRGSSALLSVLRSVPVNSLLDEGKSLQWKKCTEENLLMVLPLSW